MKTNITAKSLTYRLSMLKKPIILAAFTVALGLPALANAQDSTSRKPKTDRSSQDGMFTKKPGSWAVGIHAGYPTLVGDIPTNQLSLGFGAFVQKALGNSISIRAIGTYGWVEGINTQGNGQKTIVQNNALNGNIDPRVNYTAAPRVYTNYKTKFIKAGGDVIYNINNINFMSAEPRFGLFATLGAGVMVFNSMTDQLDANGNMYAYPNLKDKNAKEVKKDLKGILDGKYETKGDRNKSGGAYPNYLIAPAFNAGLGANYKLTDHFTLQLEASYTYAGTDLLDGQRWYGDGVPSPRPDAFFYFSLGASYRFGKTDNVYWFSNPLSMPLKQIDENKKKLQKVDDLEKKVDDMQAKTDELAARVDSLTADEDNDGVSDYFDRELGTPPGAIVNGAGQTIFYKDADGNMVFVDPNALDSTDMAMMNKNRAGGAGSGFDDANDNAGNNLGGRFGNQGNNRGSGGSYLGGSSSGKGRDANNNPVYNKKRFNPNATAGRTIIMTNDGKGGLTAAGGSGAGFSGSASSAGFLPAIFFQTNSARIDYKYYPQLFEISRVLNSNPNLKLRVIGHTDSRGTEQYNKALGSRRASAAAYALKNYFKVNPAQLVEGSDGEAQPLTRMSEADALAANRRVQFEIYQGGKASGGDYSKSKMNSAPGKKAETNKPATAPKTAPKVTPKTDLKKPANKETEIIQPTQEKPQEREFIEEQPLVPVAPADSNDDSNNDDF